MQYQPQLIVISSGYDSAIGCFEVRYIFMINNCFFSFFFLFSLIRSSNRSSWSLHVDSIRRLAMKKFN